MDRRKIGLTMIAIGVFVWVVYAALRLSGVSVTGGVALALHLVFVIPVALLAPGENLHGKLIRLFRRVKSREEPR